MSYTLGSVKNLFTTGQLGLACNAGSVTPSTIDIITKAFEAEKERLTAENRMLRQQLDTEREKTVAIQRVLNGSQGQYSRYDTLQEGLGGLIDSSYAQMLGNQIAAKQQQQCLGLRSAKSTEIKKGE